MVVASALAVLTGIGCGGRSGSGGQLSPSERGGVTLSESQAYVLESWGAQPTDTSFTMEAGLPRRVTLRYGPPDNTIFAEVFFPDSVFADSGKQVQVTIAPIPGLYGIELDTSVPLQKDVRVVFKYAVHFAVPLGARERYGSNAAFERALAIAKINPDGSYTTLPSRRPASDNLAASLPSAGKYVIVAPR